MLKNNFDNQVKSVSNIYGRAGRKGNASSPGKRGNRLKVGKSSPISSPVFAVVQTSTSRPEPCLEC